MRSKRGGRFLDRNEYSAVLSVNLVINLVLKDREVNLWGRRMSRLSGAT
jgi:hypothetical protein